MELVLNYASVYPATDASEASFKVEVWNRRELTNICTASVVTESQHSADSLGVCLLHQQLDDGLAVRFHQVFALATQRGRQVRAHFLHSVNHLLLSGKADFFFFLKTQQDQNQIIQIGPDNHAPVAGTLQCSHEDFACATGHHHGDTWNDTPPLFLIPKLQICWHVQGRFSLWSVIANMRPFGHTDHSHSCLTPR